MKRMKRLAAAAGAAVLLAACGAALRLAALPALGRLLARLAPAAAENHGGCGLDQAAAAVRRAARYTGSSCLSQAVALYVVAAMRGRAARLRVGVRKRGEGRLEAHAWLESAGRVVIGERCDLAGYTPLLDVPAGAIPRRPAPPLPRPAARP